MPYQISDLQTKDIDVWNKNLQYHMNKNVKAEIQCSGETFLEEIEHGYGGYRLY